MNRGLRVAVPTRAGHARPIPRGDRHCIGVITCLRIADDEFVQP
jgi:hypothetical protein